MAGLDNERMSDLIRAKAQLGRSPFLLTSGLRVKPQHGGTDGPDRQEQNGQFRC